MSSNFYFLFVFGYPYIFAESTLTTDKSDWPLARLVTLAEKRNQQELEVTLEIRNDAPAPKVKHYGICQQYLYLPL